MFTLLLVHYRSKRERREERTIWVAFRLSPESSADSCPPSPTTTQRGKNDGWSHRFRHLSTLSIDLPGPHTASISIFCSFSYPSLVTVVVVFGRTSRDSCRKQHIPFLSSPRDMYRIGVDVGGTNTDAAILDITALDSASRGVLATCKTATTTNVTLGIKTAIGHVLAQAGVDRSKIVNVAVGTTHFVNAVVENDARRLNRVAVVRLCGPYTRNVSQRGLWAIHVSRGARSLTTKCNIDTSILRLSLCAERHHRRPRLLQRRRSGDRRA